MTDRELLELAAKAASIAVEYDEASGLFWLGDKFTGLWWDPLTNDGDALRLAVTLAEQYQRFHKIDWNWTARGLRVFAAGYEGEGPDSCAATRRAIVNAAAQIGKTL